MSASPFFGFSLILITYQDEWPVPVGEGSGLTWLTWSYRAKHLPPDFHQDKDQYEQLMSWLWEHPYRTQGNDLYARGVVILMCLGIGLVLRDLHAVQRKYRVKGVVVDKSVRHLQKSALGWGQEQSLLRECIRLKDDILRCLGETSETDDTPPPPKHTAKSGESSKAKRSRGKQKAVADE